MAKLALDSVKVGSVYETTFWANPVTESGFRFRATHLGGKRAPKVVLCDDPRIRPGTPCRVKVRAIKNAKRPDRGAIEVEYLQESGFALDGVYLDPTASRKLQVMLESGLNVLLDGPPGCGKTLLARTLARTLGLEFVYFNCGAVVEPSDFLATLQVRAAEGGAPVTDFVKTEILAALEEATEHPRRRYLVFLDELNRCPESARNVLMPALDTTRRLFHPIQNAFVPIPENLQFIAAVNRGSEFSGTFAIDPSQLDRFAPLQMDYPPPDEEAKILRERHPELSHRLIAWIVDLAHKIRGNAEVGGALSVRATDEACTLLKHPLLEPDRRQMLVEVLKSSFCGRFPGRWSDPASEAGAVWAMIEGAAKLDGDDEEPAS